MAAILSMQMAQPPETDLKKFVTAWTEARSGKPGRSSLPAFHRLVEMIAASAAALGPPEAKRERVLAFVRRVVAVPQELQALVAADYADSHSLVAHWRREVMDALGAPSSTASYASVLPAVRGGNQKETWVRYCMRTRLEQRIELAADAWSDVQAQDPPRVDANGLDTSAIEVAAIVARVLPDCKLRSKLDLVENRAMLTAIINSDDEEIRNQPLKPGNLLYLMNFGQRDTDNALCLVGVALVDSDGVVGSTHAAVVDDGCTAGSVVSTQVARRWGLQRQHGDADVAATQMDGTCVNAWRAEPVPIVVADATSVSTRITVSFLVVDNPPRPIILGTPAILAARIERRWQEDEAMGARLCGAEVAGDDGDRSPSMVDEGVESAMLYFPEGKALIFGRQLSWTTESGESVLNLTPADVHLVHAEVCRKGAMKEMLEEQPTGLLAALVPDLSAPSASSRGDTLPGATQQSANFDYASAFDVLMHKVDACERLSSAERERVRRRLLELRPTLSLNSKLAPPSPVGPVKAPGAILELYVKQGADLGRVKAYWKPRSPDATRALEDEWDRLVRFGVAEEVFGGRVRVSSPMLMVPKRDSERRIVGHRLAIDYRQLNSVLEQDLYAPPLQSDVLELAARGDSFSLFDFSSLFHQFEVAEHCRWLTTVMIRPGRYGRFIGAPFGLSVILAHAQRVLDAIFRNETRLVYVDDGVQSHMPGSDRAGEILDFFERSAKHNACLNVDKIQLAVTQAVVLGCTVDCTTHSYEPIASRMQVLAEFPRPTTNAGLRSWLSTCSVYLRFLPGWSLTAPVLTRGIVAGRPLQWTPEMAAAWATMRQLLREACKLHEYDDRLPTHVFTDASQEGVAYVIAQDSLGDGRLRLVAAGGRRTASYEQRLHSMELEALAFRECLFKYAQFTLSMRAPTLWHPDCRGVSKMATQKAVPKSRAVRLFMAELQHLFPRIQVEWIKGTAPSFRLVDMLSRQYGPNFEAVDDAEAREPMTTDSGKFMPLVLDDVAPVDALEAAPAFVSEEKPSAIARDGAEELSRTDGATVERVGDGPTATDCESDAAAVVVGQSVLDELRKDQAARVAVRAARGDLSSPLLGRQRESEARAASQAVRVKELAQVANGRHAPQRALGLKPFRDDVGRIHVRINGEVRLLLETAADRRRFMALAHASQAGGGGHRQSAATLARLSSCVWWPSMRDDVSEFVAACLVCQQLRPPAPAQLHGDTPVVGRRFDTVHIDLASVDATAECEHKAFLVVVDSVSAMPAVLPMVDQTAERVIEAFERGWLARFGTPRVIVADNGPQLDCELMRSFARRHGIALRFVAPYHQQANGLAERTIQSIKRALRALVALDTKRTGDWTQYVHEAVWSFTTSTCPFELAKTTARLSLADGSKRTLMA